MKTATTFKHRKEPDRRRSRQKPRPQKRRGQNKNANKEIPEVKETKQKKGKPIVKIRQTKIYEKDSKDQARQK